MRASYVLEYHQHHGSVIWTDVIDLARKSYVCLLHVYVSVIDNPCMAK